MELLKNCPICGKNEFNQFLTVQDYTVSQEKFAIVQCQNCDFKFTNPRPDESEISNYYQSENYISHTNTTKGLISKAYHLVRNYTLKNKLKLINYLQPNKGSILDVGCGTGMFLKTCQNNQWEIAGVEVDAGARAIAQAQTESEIKESVWNNFENNSFDIITLWHVLEHIHPLEKMVEWLVEKLKKNGNLIIAVPNHKSWDAQNYANYWAAYDVPRHLYHFSQENITQLFQQKGMELIEIKPMYFDSFYVSMLSTKYKNEKINYFEALINGIKSNSWAKKNNQNYSSLIYIFRKN